ncbi:hypothetical protein D3C85_1621120 [compost metagenome]
MSLACKSNRDRRKDLAASSAAADAGTLRAAKSAPTSRIRSWNLDGSVLGSARLVTCCRRLALEPDARM